MGAESFPDFSNQISGPHLVGPFHTHTSARLTCPPPQNTLWKVNKTDIIPSVGYFYHRRRRLPPPPQHTQTTPFNTAEETAPGELISKPPACREVLVKPGRSRWVFTCSSSHSGKLTYHWKIPWLGSLFASSLSRMFKEEVWWEKEGALAIPFPGPKVKNHNSLPDRVFVRFQDTYPWDKEETWWCGHLQHMTGTGLISMTGLKRLE